VATGDRRSDWPRERREGAGNNQIRAAILDRDPFPGAWTDVQMRGVWYALAFVVVPAVSSAAFFGLLLRSSGAWAVLPICGGAIAFVLLAERWHRLTEGPIPEGVRSPYAIAALSFLAVPVIALVAAVVIVLLLGSASNGGNTL
jgi:hypothetical protein